MEKSPGTNIHPSYKRGFRIGIIVGAIVIVVVVLSAQFNKPYQSRNPDSDAKANLHNVFLACKAYWADNGSDAVCTSMKIKSTLYGYIQSADVSISVSGPENDFSATAQNTNSENTFRMDSNGTITEVD